jgi:ATP-dependent DNA helicase RecQ
MTEHDEPLATLPSRILAHVTGERRRRLIDYLLRWQRPDAALRCLETWLAAQPHLATLREARALALLECGRAHEALAPLDELDAERGITDSRRTLRIRALAALGRFDEAHTLVPSQPSDPRRWRLRAELLRRERRFDEAATALAELVELLPGGVAPLRAMAELALERGDGQHARRLLEAAPGEEEPSTAVLLLLLRAAEQCGDEPACLELERRLAARRVHERALLCAELGLDVIENSAAPDDHNSPLAARDEPELPAEAMTALRTHFGFEAFRPGQAALIAHVLRGESVLGVLPTGAGKSLTYQLPALLLPGATLVLSPLIALMKDQIDGLPATLTEHATAIHSGLAPAEVAERLRGVAAGRFRLVYVAPERLRQQPFIQALRQAGVARVVVDEAHCVSLWGVSFRPDYLFIGRALEALGHPPVLALTATATPETAAEIAAQLGTGLTVRTSVFRPNLRFEVLHVAGREEKLEAIRELCRSIAGPIVVYARSRDMCEVIAASLRAAGVAAQHYHALVADRSAVQERFMRGQTRVLVATVAFGMGVDKADVRAIIHYNLPQSLEAYYQEAGRAGRDGEPARCVLLYASADKGQLTNWLREDTLTRDYLRTIYSGVRRRARGNWGIVALDALRREAGDDDETRSRVALGMLERLGLLERHFDLPRTASVVLRAAGATDPELSALRVAGGLAPGMNTPLDLLDVAGELGCAPDELELRLLEWHQRGLLHFEGHSRDVLLELKPAPPDSGEKLEALLSDYTARQDARIDAIVHYARRASCRQRALAAHFGEQRGPCGTACDICAGSEQRVRRANPQPARIPPAARTQPVDAPSEIVRCVAQLPFAVGRSGLVKVLKGSAGSAIGPDRCPHYAALSHLTIARIEQEIDALIADGRLARRLRDRMPLLELTARGRAALHETQC